MAALLGDPTAQAKQASKRVEELVAQNKALAYHLRANDQNRVSAYTFAGLYKDLN